MLTRVYIDNFRCFANFEWRPGRRQLIMGPNGSGKSSLLNALLLVRQFVNLGHKIDDQYMWQARTRWMNQVRQTCEIEARLNDQTYIYRLVLEAETWGEPPRTRIASESVHLDGAPIFEFVDGEVRLFNDRLEHKVTYEFDWSRSALATIVPRKDNTRLTTFKHWFRQLVCFRINPFAMGSRAEGEQLFPNVDLSNFAQWYRHLIQAFPKENAAFIKDLCSAIDGFTFLNLESVGENIRVLVAEFGGEKATSTKFTFDELSDGQRCLISLYAILHFVLATGGTVIIDEPDNFVALREIQPWLTTAEDVIEDKRGQLLVISHHPEFINQWAPELGVRFIRERSGPVRLKDFQADTESTLTPAELVARGWDLG